MDKLVGQLILWLLIVFGPAFAFILFIELCKHGFGFFAMLLLAALITGLADCMKSL